MAPYTLFGCSFLQNQAPSERRMPKKMAETRTRLVTLRPRFTSQLLQTSVRQHKGYLTSTERSPTWIRFCHWMISPDIASFEPGFSSSFWNYTSATERSWKSRNQNDKKPTQWIRLKIKPFPSLVATFACPTNYASKIRPFLPPVSVTYT